MAEHDERRRAERLDANLNLEVKLSRADGTIETTSLETINISTSGVYFRSDHFIEPMTKLAMELEVRVPGAKNKVAATTAPVPCEGLVVRANPEGPVADCADYEIAVFFTHIEPEGMANLQKHIAMLLTDSD